MDSSSVCLRTCASLRLALNLNPASVSGTAMRTPQNLEIGMGKSSPGIPESEGEDEREGRSEQEQEEEVYP
jgi:hypothetical protein